MGIQASKTDIVLIQPPGWAVQNPPLGLALLKAVLKKEGLSAKVFDLNILLYNLKHGIYKEAWELSNGYYAWERRSYVEKMFEYFGPEILGFIYTVLAVNPEVIGFSAHCSSLISAQLLASKFKQIAPEIKIVFGGPQVSEYTSHWQEMLKQGVADAVIFGEGEITLPEFLRSNKTKSAILIKGCAFKDGNNRIIKGNTRELIPSLDTLPFPDYSDFDLDVYCGKNVLPTYFSRGCVNQCIYCTESKYFPKFRNRSGKRVFEEIKFQLDKYPWTREFRMHDSLSNGNVRELEALCDLLISNKIEIKWSLENAIVRKEMTSVLYAKLKKAGCHLIGYGLENPSKRLLLSVGKTACLDADFEKVIIEGVLAGITIGLNIMFGLPGETRDEHELLIEYLMKLKKYRKRIQINPALNFCYFPEGCAVRLDPGRYGVDLSLGELYWSEKDGSNTFLERLEKFEAFCLQAQKLGYENIFGVVQALNRYEMLGKYYYKQKKYDIALRYLLGSFSKEMKTVELAEDIIKIFHETQKVTDSTYEILKSYIDAQKSHGDSFCMISGRIELEDYLAVNDKNRRDQMLAAISKNEFKLSLSGIKRYAKLKIKKLMGREDIQKTAAIKLLTKMDYIIDGTVKQRRLEG